MRKAASNLVAIILLIATSYSQSTDRGPQIDAVLTQTTDWLKPMIAAHARSVKKYADGSTLENHIDDIEFDACSLKYKDVTSSQRNGRVTMDQVFTFIVSLAELDAAESRSEIQEDRPRLILYTIEDKKTIRGTAWWEVDHVWKVAAQESAYQSRIVIPFDSLEAAEQVAKYLTQAIKLCQSRTRS